MRLDGRPARRFDLLQTLLQALETVRLVEARKIVQPGGKFAPAFLVQFEAREARRGDPCGLAKFLHRNRTAREAEHRKFVRRDPLSASPQIIQRWNQLAFREIAGSAEDHDRAGWRGLRLGNMNRFRHWIIQTS